MRWPRRRRRLPRPRIGETVTIGTERDRVDLREHLRDGLAELTRLLTTATAVLEVQLVVQVCGASRYPTWRREREAKWQRDREYSTSRWPQTLPPSAHAVLLLPAPAGRVGPALGRHPQNIATPAFTVTDGTPPADAVLVLITAWICNPAAGYTARLAPPVIDTIGHARTIESYGLHWPLPAADGR